eukprot:4424710-Prymnesium_polylepis.1
MPYPYFLRHSASSQPRARRRFTSLSLLSNLHIPEIDLSGAYEHISAAIDEIEQRSSKRAPPPRARKGLAVTAAKHPASSRLS